MDMSPPGCPLLQLFCLLELVVRFIPRQCLPRFLMQETVEEAAMGNVDRNDLTPNQLAVESLIKDQNFTWKASDADYT